MKVPLKKKIALAGSAVGYGLVAASPSFAQVTQLTSGLDWIKGTITGVGSARPQYAGWGGAQADSTPAAKFCRSRDSTLTMELGCWASLCFRSKMLRVTLCSVRRSAWTTQVPMSLDL